MKGAIQPDHIPVNKYKLKVLGLLDITVVSVSGIEETLQTTDLPDRTRASGGNTEAVEFDIMVPAHHLAEQAAMEAWYRESQDPVSPLYKKAATLILESLSGSVKRTFQLVGLFPTGRGLPDLEMENEGEMANIKWPMSADDITPL